MTKLPQISECECISTLQRAGFEVARQSGSHIILKRLDPKARVTVPNHNPIKPGTLRSIIRDAGLTPEEFVRLLNE